jgi:hypothetical protein
MAQEKRRVCITRGVEAEEKRGPVCICMRRRRSMMTTMAGQPLKSLTLPVLTYLTHNQEDPKIRALDLASTPNPHPIPSSKAPSDPC